MKFTILSFVTAFAVSGLASTKASIHSVGEHQEPVVVALDLQGVPRINSWPKTYPTIKDYRDGGELEGGCYKGSVTQVKSLLTALVEAANGDGDSWADLKAIKTLKNEVLKVTVYIEDESGGHTEDFKFSPCEN